MPVSIKSCGISYALHWVYYSRYRHRVESMGGSWRYIDFSTGSCILAAKPSGCTCKGAERPSMAYLERISKMQ